MYHTSIMLFLFFYLDHISIFLSWLWICKEVILNVMVPIKSFFGGFYDSNKLFCINGGLQTDLSLHFLKDLCYVHIYGQIKHFSLSLSLSFNVTSTIMCHCEENTRWQQCMTLPTTKASGRGLWKNNDFILGCWQCLAL